MPRGKPGSGQGAKKRRHPIQLGPRWCIKCSSQFTPAAGRYGARQIYCTHDDLDECKQSLYKLTRSLTFEFVQAATIQGYRCAVCGTAPLGDSVGVSERQQSDTLASQQPHVEQTHDSGMYFGNDPSTHYSLQVKIELLPMLILTWGLSTPDNVVAVCKSCRALWYLYLSQMPPAGRERMKLEVLTLSELQVFIADLQQPL